jgi:hypothetical protein
MRIPVVGITVSMTALLCGCGLFSIYLATDGCPPSEGNCPNPTISESGGQCTYTYYTDPVAFKDEGAAIVSCTAHTTTAP